MTATLDMTPWARAALTREQRDDLLRRAYAAGVHLFLAARRAGGPYLARTAEAPERRAVGRDAYATAVEVLG